MPPSYGRPEWPVPKEHGEEEGVWPQIFPEQEGHALQILEMQIVSKPFWGASGAKLGLPLLEDCH